jgi:hypothetical protein
MVGSVQTGAYPRATTAEGLSIPVKIAMPGEVGDSGIVRPPTTRDYDGEQLFDQRPFNNGRNHETWLWGSFKIREVELGSSTTSNPSSTRYEISEVWIRSAPPYGKEQTIPLDLPLTTADGRPISNLKDARARASEILGLNLKGIEAQLGGAARAFEVMPAGWNASANSRQENFARLVFFSMQHEGMDEVKEALNALSLGQSVAFSVIVGKMLLSKNPLVRAMGEIINVLDDADDANSIAGSILAMRDSYKNAMETNDPIEFQVQARKFSMAIGEILGFAGNAVGTRGIRLLIGGRWIGPGGKLLKDIVTTSPRPTSPRTQSGNPQRRATPTGQLVQVGELDGSSPRGAAMRGALLSATGDKKLLSWAQTAKVGQVFPYGDGGRVTVVGLTKFGVHLEFKLPPNFGNNTYFVVEYIRKGKEKGRLDLPQPLKPIVQTPNVPSLPLSSATGATETSEQTAARHARALQEQQRLMELWKQSDADHLERVRIIKQESAVEIAKIRAFGEQLQAENAERNRQHDAYMAAADVRIAQSRRDYERQLKSQSVSAAESARVKFVYTPYLAAIQQIKKVGIAWQASVKKYNDAVRHLVKLQAKLERDLIASEAMGVTNLIDLRSQLERIKNEYGSLQSKSVDTTNGLRYKLLELSRDLSELATKMKAMYDADQRSGRNEILTDYYLVAQKYASDTLLGVTRADEGMATGRGWVRGAEERLRALEGRALRPFGLDSGSVQTKLVGAVVADIRKSVDALAKVRGTTAEQEYARLSSVADEAATLLGEIVARVRGAANGLTPAQIATLRQGLQKEIADLPAQHPPGQSPRLKWIGQLLNGDPANYQVWQRLLERYGSSAGGKTQQWERIPDNDKAWEHIKKNNPDLADTIERALRENPDTVTREGILDLMRRGATVLEAIAALKGGGANLGGVPPGNNNKRVVVAGSPDESNSSPQQLYEALDKPKTIKVIATGLEFNVAAIEQLGQLEVYEQLRRSLGTADVNKLLNAFARGGIEAVFKVAPNLSLNSLGNLAILTFGLKGLPTWHDLQHLFGKVTSFEGGSYNISVSGEAKGVVTTLHDLIGRTRGEASSFYEDVRVTRDASGRMQVQISDETARAIEERFEAIFKNREAFFSSEFSRTGIAAMPRLIKRALGTKSSKAFIESIAFEGLMPSKLDRQLVQDLQIHFSKFIAAHARLSGGTTQLALEKEFSATVLNRLSQAATQEFMKASKQALREQFLRGVAMSASLRAIRGFPAPANTNFDATWQVPIPQDSRESEFRDVLEITTQILKRLGR